MAITTSTRSAGHPLVIERMTPVGLFLLPHLTSKGWKYRELAKALDLPEKSGAQVIRRLFAGPTRTFPQIGLADLVAALELTAEDLLQLDALIKEGGITFADTLAPLGAAVSQGAGDPRTPRMAPAATSKRSDTLEWAMHWEPDLIYRLHRGDAERVAQEAQWCYDKIRSDRTLPRQEAREWLIRYAKLIEQAQEVGRKWHSERAGPALVALRQLDRDLEQIEPDNAWKGLYREQIILWGRRAVLWREAYRDVAPRSARNLDMSLALFDQGLAHLVGGVRGYTRYVLDPVLETVLRCQQLHIRAIQGDPGWRVDIASLAADIERATGLGRAGRDMLIAMVDYFTSVGYKRLAWALRPRNDEDRRDRALAKVRAECYHAAKLYYDKFRSSPHSLVAWQAANFYPVGLPDGAYEPNAQLPLVSADQARLLLDISEIETRVWLEPDTVRTLSPHIESRALQIYTSATVKVANTQAFANFLIQTL